MALFAFLERITQKWIKIRSDNATAVVYVQRQGGTKSARLIEELSTIMSWVEINFRGLVAFYVPGKMNVQADFLSRNALEPGEWSLNLSVFQTIGNPEIDLMASDHNHKCRRFFSRYPLERDGRLCLSTLSINLEGVEENRQRRDTSDSNNSILAQASLVSAFEADVSGASNETTDCERSTDAGSSFLSRGVPLVVEGVEVERQRFSDMGLEKDLIELLLKSRKPSTSISIIVSGNVLSSLRKIEDLIPDVLVRRNWCSFSMLGTKGSCVSTLRGQVSALSELTERSWAEVPLVIRLFNALKRVCPVRRLRMPPWDLPLVLKVLTAVPFEPLEEASDWHVTLKSLFLVTITSACRVGEIHSLSAKEPDTILFPDKVVLRPAFEFLPKVVSQFQIDLEITLPSCSNPKTERERQWHTLDLVRIISHYLTRTQSWRR
ncbi:uncharacterized protein LOC108709773 [Xenopus laevis]|uniref:Uncharacterized protein LOC108709773 n=1 Tax=Xenopus laevis TaxID=8355 RepID=A0A8J0UP78_XENLA|nr:uncharacterized protein LOC108709773 [Xenopus laevis]